MAIRTKMASKLLNKKDQQHLTQTGIKSMSAFVSFVKKQQEEQTKAEKLHGNDIPALLAWCPHCWTIAKKMELI